MRGAGERRAPERGVVELWTARLDAAGAAPGLAALLSDEERLRAARLRRPADRERFVAAHALLREVLALYEGGEPARLELVHGPYGKPALRSREVGFSLARSGDVALVAVAAGEVGVDVELVRPGIAGDGLVDRYLTAAERAEVASAPTGGLDAAATALWARKEALLKAAGTGLAHDPAAVCAAAAAGRSHLLGDALGAVGEWSVADVPVPAGYAAAVAAAGRGFALRRLDGWPLSERRSRRRGSSPAR